MSSLNEMMRTLFCLLLWMLDASALFVPVVEYLIAVPGKAADVAHIQTQYEKMNLILCELPPCKIRPQNSSLLILSRLLF
uniref:Uncharacterized protein n=1 Tax=Salix viminalis TaxID=40686 RepID=A0A6N2NL86_SALVM